MAEELIYTALANVMADMSAVKKSKKNTQGAGFNYRGIDDVMNALHPALVKNGVVVVPQVIAKEREERQSKSGGLNIYSIVTMSFKFFAKDGSFVEAVTVGEAMDSGDKATNKAMSVALKYACFQVLMIPTEEMLDPDSETHEVAPDFIDELKQKVFVDTCNRKGIDDKQMYKKVGKAEVSELTTAEFMRLMKLMEKLQTSRAIYRCKRKETKMERKFNDSQTEEMLIEGKNINDLMKEKEYLKSLEKKACEIELEGCRLKTWCLDRLIESINMGATLEELKGLITLEKKQR